MRRRGSVIAQLLAGFSVVAVLIGVATLVNFLGVSHQNAVAQQVTGRYTVLQQHESALESAYGTADFSILFYAVTGQKVYLSPVGPSRASFYQNLAALRRNATPGLRDLIEVQAKAGSQWFAMASELAKTAPRTAAARTLSARAKDLGTQFLAALTAAQNRLHGDIEELTNSSKHALRTGLVWSSAAVLVALLMVLVSSLSTVYTVTRPLRALTATVGRLTRGEHAARAVVTGSVEVREVAQSVNRQADEADRLRAAEAESNRLHAAAREAGLRIREPLIAEDVLRQARIGLEQTVTSDRVALRLIEGDQLTTPAGIGPEPWWPSVGARLDREALLRLRRMLGSQRSSVIQDMQGPDGQQVPAQFRDWVRSQQVGCQIVTPFGLGQELIGILIVQRMLPARTWTAAEVDAVESIAADIARGLNHARLYEAEGKLVKDLESLDAAKSDFFATVSHELRSPLTTVEGYVEMLSEDPHGRLDSEQRGMIDAIDRGTTRLRALIDDVFMLAKLESSAFATVTRPVKLADVVSSAVEAIAPSAREKRVKLTVTGPDGELTVDGDTSQLDRLMLNLLSNAVKFTPPDGQVTVRTAAEGESAVISVSDTGIGIPEAELKNLFTRFFRASNAAKQAIPGTGLGLAIVHTIVANHHGTISVESSEAAGTTFTVRLPYPLTADTPRSL